jgi:hypothetical protein
VADREASIQRELEACRKEFIYREIGADREAST